MFADDDVNWFQNKGALLHSAGESFECVLNEADGAAKVNESRARVDQVHEMNLKRAYAHDVWSARLPRPLFNCVC